jgi:hypothetical protein
LELNKQNYLDQCRFDKMNKNHEQLEIMNCLDLIIEFDEKILMLDQYDMYHFHLIIEYVDFDYQL